MANNYNSATITTSATRIVSLKNTRRGTLIFNNSSQTVYLGMDNLVTTSNGLPLVSNATFMSSGYLDIWRGDVWAIVAATTSDVRFWDWEEV